jgi:predicted nucleic acid-binding protein
MVYVDTSVIVAYYCPEPLSEKAEAFLTAHSRPAISTLTELEFFSALARKMREGSLGRKIAGQIISKFLSHADGGFYVCHPVESHHYRLARDWIALFTTKLKPLDALHLAIASSEGRTLVTADQELFDSARALAVEAMFLKED